MRAPRMLVLGCAAWCAVAAVSNARAAAPHRRERIRLDAGWRFRLGDPEGSAGTAIRGWRWKSIRSATRTEAEATLPGPDDEGWQAVEPGADTFHGRRGFAWYRVTLPAGPAPSPSLHFESVDDDAVVFLNGKRISQHEGWSEPFDVPTGSAWRNDAPNVLTVLVENHDGPGGVGAASLEHPLPVEGTGPAAPEFRDDDWRVVHLPHDFVVESGFDPKADVSHGFHPANAGWYRLTFPLPAGDRGRRLWLDFDGVYRNSDVWLNGRHLGHHKSGYTGFRYDISDAARYGGANTLAVRADARAFEGWWYEGGGIYRHVWLNKADAVHVVPDSVFVSPGVAEGGPAAIEVEVAVANQAPRDASAEVEGELRDPEGRAVGHVTVPVTVAANGMAPARLRLTVSEPEWWSLEHPALYRWTTRIRRDGRDVDAVTTPFGIRTIRFDAGQGFFLNGKPLKIQGTCNHQDMAGVGIALPDSLQEWRVRRLRSIGCNAYRCSHNPPTPELLDACDRLGMLVMDENRHLGDTYRDHTPPGTPYADLTDLSDLIRRDRNHPSVVMWSMCNEEGLQGTAEGARIFRAMQEVVRRLDPTRPVTCAMNGGWGQGISLVEDLQGCNYNPGGYDGFHRAHPAIPMYGSEVGSTVSTRGIYANDSSRGYVSAYDVNAPSWAQTAEVTWRSIAERPFVAGGFVWTGFDYRGEPTPYGWPCINSHFGILDTCGFPKDNAYYYQAWWSDRPMVHLLPHWNWEPGREVPVWAYSNADRVELRLNGSVLGSREMPRYGHVEWKVPFRPGRLEAIAYRRGREVARDTVETAGPAARIRLQADRSSLKADGEDVMPVEVTVVDTRGRVVPTADQEVRFAVRGAGSIAGVGNGDPSSHEPDQADHRRAFNGRCMVLVRAGERSGRVELTATAANLQSARLTLRAR